MKRISLIIILIIIVSNSCSNNKKPEELIEISKYKMIMKDLILAQKIKEMRFKNDSLDFNPVELVYETYKIDSLALKKSTDYYSKNPEIFKEIYSEIKKELKQKQDSFDKLLDKKGVIKKEIKKNDKIKVLKKDILPNLH